MAANSKAPPKPSKPDPKKDARNALHVLAMQYQKAISSDHSVFTWPVCQRLFLELQNQASAAGVINLTKYMADALSWKDFQKDMKIKELSYKAESLDHCGNSDSNHNINLSQISKRSRRYHTSHSRSYSPVRRYSRSRSRSRQRERRSKRNRSCTPPPAKESVKIKYTLHTP